MDTGTDGSGGGGKELTRYIRLFRHMGRTPSRSISSSEFWDKKGFFRRKLESHVFIQSSWGYGVSTYGSITSAPTYPTSANMSISGRNGPQVSKIFSLVWSTHTPPFLLWFLGIFFFVSSCMVDDFHTAPYSLGVP